MSATEARKRFLSLVRDLVASNNGFTINDIMETDYVTLFNVLNAEELKQDKEEIMSLEDFINMTGGD
ncbi:hypothetical protein C6A33_01335 [Streptococcus anginosus]|uniref:Uncharacterized protein n=1 Tax=Streptococcus anginosus TaxID=1328 RepID=A0A2T0FUD7_STRAP|nr:hypothetical protein F6H96_08290 [Streptococcus anginosus]MBF7050574.1 hypothetical protein [Streptococcus sp. HF-2466]PRT63913.1 hypothetical protein C6A33_01335 [Streptococcus anginosus]RGT61688.1 hypothetical protein DWX18_03390 [Streptococcus anginosus]RGY87032.1 hypothetical protein DXA16_05860 [Streptococcus anginosus]